MHITLGAVTRTLSIRNLAIHPNNVNALLRKTFSQSSNQSQVLLDVVPSSPSIVCVSLNRPQSKNAISMQLLKEFKSCLDVIRNDPSVRSVIIRSSQPGSFCAGADLVERRTMTKPQVQTFLTDLRSTLSLLENLPMPTIAAVDGPALGGGLEISLACDLRVASSEVDKLGLPETRLGIIPGAGGTQRATRLLGLSKAKDLIFTGRILNSREAKEWGLIDYIAEPPQSASERAIQLASEMLSSAPLALRAAKLAISRASDLALESGLDFENACYQPLLNTKDRDEALLAFKEKRSPNFKGE